MRRLPLRKKLLFTAMIIGTCLVILELSLRLFWTRPAKSISFGIEIMQRDEQLGWRPKANQSYATHYNGAPYEITVRTNSRGFRDLEHELTNERGTPRIVVLGDSFVYGSGVSNGEIFTDRVQEQLPEVEVINLGVTGYRTLQYHRVLEQEGLRFRPKIVVLGFCQNDIVEQYIPQKNPHETPPSRRNWRDYLNEHCYLADFVGGRVSRWKPLSKMLISIGVKRPLGGFDTLSDNVRSSLVEYPPQLEAMWEATLREVENVKKTCDENSAKLLVAAIPAREAIESDSFGAALAAVKYEAGDFDLAKPYAALGEYCRSHHIEYVEGFHAAREESGPLYLPNDVHFNPAGHKLFGAILAAKIKKLLSTE